MNDPDRGYKRLARAIADKDAQRQLEIMLKCGFTNEELVCIKDPHKPHRRQIVPKVAVEWKDK